METPLVQQIVAATRFCDLNKPRFISEGFWNAVLADTLDELVAAGVAFTPTDLFWATITEAKNRAQAPEKALTDLALVGLKTGTNNGRTHR